MKTTIPNFDTFETQIEDISRFLSRWRFEASVSGFLRIQPVGPNLKSVELSEVICRLLKVYRRNPPHVIAFDFSDATLPIWQWRQIREMLQMFARSIGAGLQIVSAGSRSVAIAIVGVVGHSSALPRIAC